MAAVGLKPRVLQRHTVHFPFDIAPLGVYMSERETHTKNKSGNEETIAMCRGGTQVGCQGRTQSIYYKKKQAVPTFVSLTERRRGRRF